MLDDDDQKLSIAGSGFGLQGYLVLVNLNKATFSCQ